MWLYIMITFVAMGPTTSIYRHVYLLRVVQDLCWEERLRLTRESCQGDELPLPWELCGAPL